MQCFKSSKKVRDGKKNWIKKNENLNKLAVFQVLNSCVHKKEWKKIALEWTVWCFIKARQKSSIERSKVVLGVSVVFPL